MVINTVITRQGHIQDGFWSFGSGPKNVIILGSCRVLPYAQYFDYLNADNRFTIVLIDVVNFYYDEQDRAVDPLLVTSRFENSPRLLEAFQRCQWFIHEHTANFGMFNTSRAESKNIYQFGIKPEIDVMLPNYNDHFVLFQDLVSFNPRIQAKARTENGVLGQETQAEMKAIGLKDIARFLDICQASSLPEFGSIFQETWTKIRYWQTCNHISNNFTIAIMRLLNERFLHLDIPGSFWTRVSSEDMYANPHTPITKYDQQNYAIAWPEQVEPLKF